MRTNRRRTTVADVDAILSPCALGSSTHTYSPRQADAANDCSTDLAASEVPRLHGGEGWGEGESQNQFATTLHLRRSILGIR